MLRYFYIIVCIQVCFCSVYVDNNDYEVLDRRVRCKATKLHKKTTRTPRKSRLVQFDVQNFMRTGDSLAVEDTTLYGFRNKKRQNRLLSADDADFIAPLEQGKLENGFDTRSTVEKFQNPRHFNFHSRAFDDKNDAKVSQEHKKAMSSSKQNKLVDDRGLGNHQEKKCSFRNMKIPFFSRNKATVKSKRHKHKKRRIFNFNCVKKPEPASTISSRTNETPVTKSFDINKDNKITPSASGKTKSKVKVRKIRKRAYEQLCPKCIKELVMNLKKKTTKKFSHSSTASNAPAKTTTKKRTVKQRADLSDSLQEGYTNAASDRLKRNEDEEQERERRLKELEEVEKKIENVHVAAPTFTRNSH